MRHLLPCTCICTFAALSAMMPLKGAWQGCTRQGCSGWLLACCGKHAAGSNASMAPACLLVVRAATTSQPPQKPSLLPSCLAMVPSQQLPPCSAFSLPCCCCGFAGGQIAYAADRVHSNPEGQRHTRLNMSRYIEGPHLHLTSGTQPCRGTQLLRLPVAAAPVAVAVAKPPSATHKGLLHAPHRPNDCQDDTLSHAGSAQHLALAIVHHPSPTTIS